MTRTGEIVRIGFVAQNFPTLKKKETFRLEIFLFLFGETNFVKVFFKNLSIFLPSRSREWFSSFPNELSEFVSISEERKTFFLCFHKFVFFFSNVDSTWRFCCSNGRGGQKCWRKRTKRRKRNKSSPKLWSPNEVDRNRIKLDRFLLNFPWKLVEKRFCSKLDTCCCSPCSCTFLLSNAAAQRARHKKKLGAAPVRNIFSVRDRKMFRWRKQIRF